MGSGAVSGFGRSSRSLPESSGSEGGGREGGMVDVGDFVLMVTLLAGFPESEASSMSEAGAMEAVREVPSNDKVGLTRLPLSRRGRFRVAWGSRSSMESLINGDSSIKGV